MKKNREDVDSDEKRNRSPSRSFSPPPAPRFEGGLMVKGRGRSMFRMVDFNNDERSRRRSGFGRNLNRNARGIRSNRHRDTSDRFRNRSDYRRSRSRDRNPRYNRSRRHGRSRSRSRSRSSSERRARNRNETENQQGREEVAKKIAERARKLLETSPKRSGIAEKGDLRADIDAAKAKKAGKVETLSLTDENLDEKVLKKIVQSKRKSRSRSNSDSNSSSDSSDS